jgi:hypothetical protein
MSADLEAEVLRLRRQVQALLDLRAGHGPGLERMREATPPGLCPFCLDPLAEWCGTGRRPTTCGDRVCWTAWHRTYKRDYRRKEREER